MFQIINCMRQLFYKSVTKHCIMIILGLTNGFELSSKQKARVINYKKGEETCIFLYFFLLLFMK